MHVGIVGGGYVGSKAAIFWKTRAHIVSVTTRNSENIEKLSSVAQHVHLLTADSFVDFVRNQEILLICVAPSHGEDYLSTYLDTASQIATVLPEAPNLKQIIYTSSTSVYGDLEGKWAHESDICCPKNESGQILLQTESILLQCRSTALKVCIFRLGEIFGPGRNIVDRLKRIPNTVLAGNGESYTNLTQIEDIIGALDFAFTQQLDGIYNLCNDFHLPRREFYDQLCREHNLPLFSWDPSRPTLHSGNKKVSNDKIKAAGFQFTHPESH